MSLVAKRRPKKKSSGVYLNLAAMMDIFTLLVFFLLVNTGQAELLSPPPELKLPVSIAQTPPDPHLVVSVTAEGVKVAGKPVMAMADILAATDDVLVPLRDALLVLHNAMGVTASTAVAPIAGAALAGSPAAAAQTITVMGDKSIPYQVLKRVMASCQAAAFTEIDLAIKQQTPGAAVTTAPATAQAATVHMAGAT